MVGGLAWWHPCPAGSLHRLGYSRLLPFRPISPRQPSQPPSHFVVLCLHDRGQHQGVAHLPLLQPRKGEGQRFCSVIPCRPTPASSRPPAPTNKAQLAAHPSREVGDRGQHRARPLHVDVNLDLQRVGGAQVRSHTWAPRPWPACCPPSQRRGSAAPRHSACNLHLPATDSGPSQFSPRGRCSRGH